MIKQLINYTRRQSMSKKKNKGQFDHYKTFTLKDGTKFLARDEHDANLYREKVGDFIIVDDAGVNIETGKFTG